MLTTKSYMHIMIRNISEKNKYIYISLNDITSINFIFYIYTKVYSHIL